MAAFTLSLGMPAFDTFKRRALAQAEVLVPVATQTLVGRAGVFISARLQGVAATSRILWMISGGTITAIIIALATRGTA